MNDITIIKNTKESRKKYTAVFVGTKISTENTFAYHFFKDLKVWYCFEDVRNEKEVLIKPEWTYFEYVIPEERSQLLKELELGDKVLFVADLIQDTNSPHGNKFENVEFIKKI